MNGRIVTGAHGDLRLGEAQLLAVGVHEPAEALELEKVEPDPLAKAGEILADRVRVPRFVTAQLAVALALLVVLLIKAPDGVEISILPTIILTVRLALIVEVISVATDKADLLNRLGED